MPEAVVIVGQRPPLSKKYLAGALERDAQRAVLSDDGRDYPADAVLVGVGIAPAEELAASAGIA